MFREKIFNVQKSDGQDDIKLKRAHILDERLCHSRKHPNHLQCWRHGSKPLAQSVAPAAQPHTLSQPRATATQSPATTGTTASTPMQAHNPARTHYIALDVPFVFWLFVLCCLIGLIGETLVSYPIDGIWKNRAGLIWGPFSPIYGLGGVLFTFVLNRFWKCSALTQFIVSAITGGAVEGFGGFILKNLFGIVAWNYLNHPLNFAGYTSVPMMCVWGACGCLWFRFALPVFYRCYSYCKKHLSSRVFKIFTTIFMAYMVADIVFTLIGFNCWYLRLNGQEPNTPVQQFFAQNYNDDYMSSQFGALSMHPDVVRR